MREGRRREFAAFARFRDPAVRDRIPDPGASETFLRSKLRWEEREEGVHAEWLALYRTLLALRARHIVPHLEGAACGARFHTPGAAALAVDWTLGDGARLHLRANFDAEPAPELARAPGATLHVEGAAAGERGLGPWSGAWTVEDA